jgi:hypothetical protein
MLITRHLADPLYSRSLQESLRKPITVIISENGKLYNFPGLHEADYQGDWNTTPKRAVVEE